MATDKQSLAVIARWLEGLADICVHQDGGLTKKKRDALALQLGEVLPSAAFTSASARDCAKGDFFPGFDGINTRVAEWWAAHKPNAAPLLLPPNIDASALAAADKSWLEFWFKNRPAKAQEEDDIRRAGKWRDETQLPLARLASLVRRQSPAAWAIISGDRLEKHTEPTEDEIEYVKRKAAEIRQQVFGSTDPRSTEPRSKSPERQLAELPSFPPASKASPLSPELLAERRAAAGIRTNSGIDW